MADGDVVITARPENGTTTPEPAAESPHPETRREDRVQKLNKRQRRMMRDAHRPLDSWERYRALTDVIDEQVDLIDLADHKARFALIIMGALNAFLFIIASNTDAFDAVPYRFRLALGIYVLVYAIGTLNFFVQAIESLRPRRAHPSIGA